MKAEPEPMESDYWQSKTEPLDSEYWEPVWAARIIFVGGIMLFAAAIICIIVTPLIWPNEWRRVVAWCFGAGLFLLALLRQKKRMRLLRDAGLQGRIRKFRVLRKREWNLAIGELLADSSVEFVDEHGMVLPHPLAGEAKQSVLLARDGNLLAEIHEAKGRVGSIQLALITSEQMEANQS
jgi:hypothetical protein